MGTDPNAIVITPNGKTVYVSNLNSFNITPIRTATNRALRPVFIGHNPFALAVTPDGKTVYADSGDRVTPIRTATNTARRAIRVGPGFSFAMAVTPDGKTVYVLKVHTVIPIRIGVPLNKAGKPIKVGTFPEVIAITPALADYCLPCVAP